LRHLNFLATALAVLAGCGAGRVPAHAWSVQDLSYDGSDPVRRVAIYRPLGGAPRPLPWVFGIHGGAFMVGNRNDLATYADEFCPLGCAVCSVEYHLTTAPGGTWPAPLRDCQACLRFLRVNATSLGLDPDHFVAMGGSAGGCLATHLGLEETYAGDPARARYVVDDSGEQDFRLLGGCMSNDAEITTLLLGHPAPWTDAELLGPSNVQRARSDVDFFVVHGTADQDVFVLNSDLLAFALQGAGASVEYHRVAGGGTFARSDPGTTAALHAWLEARLK
jgi:acetyl esterase/lipase